MGKHSEEATYLWFSINAVYGFGPQGHKQNQKRLWFSGGHV